MKGKRPVLLYHCLSKLEMEQAGDDQGNVGIQEAMDLSPALIVSSSILLHTTRAQSHVLTWSLWYPFLRLFQTQGHDDGSRMLIQNEVASEEDRLDFSSPPSMVSQLAVSCLLFSMYLRLADILSIFSKV